MKRAMEAIRKQAVLTFAKSSHSGQTFEDNLTKLHSLMSKITSSDVILDYELLERPVSHPAGKVRSVAPVTYVDIMEDPNFTINMFVLRDGSCIPLHDHPLMHGVLKVVHGKVSVRSYSLLEESAGPLPDGSLIVNPENDVEVSHSDDAIILRHFTRNIHEIKTIDGPAAFVDVLAPPYHSLINGKPRLCHYYAEHETNPDGHVILKRTDRHEDFWTDWAPYLGPPLDES